MKNTYTLLFIFSLLTSSATYSQGFEQAKALLDRVSETMKSKQNIRFDFTYVLENKQENIRQELQGEVTLAGDKYKLNFLEAIQLFDGEKIYTIVPDDEEITISLPEDEEDVSVNPSQLLSFYEAGYAYEWDIEQRVMGRKIQFIKLIPTLASSDVKYLLLGIDTDRLEVYRLIEIGANGTRTTLTLGPQKFNLTLPAAFFDFDATNYPNFYIND